MPTKPKHPCRWPGCPELTDGRYCAKHQHQSNADYERYRRDPGTKARYGPAWAKIRRSFLNRNPLCEECMRTGKMTPATEVHHMIPLVQGGTHAYSNLQALCHSCHSRKTVAEAGHWTPKQKGYV